MHDADWSSQLSQTKSQGLLCWCSSKRSLVCRDHGKDSLANWALSIEEPCTLLPGTCTAVWALCDVLPWGSHSERLPTPIGNIQCFIQLLLFLYKISQVVPFLIAGHIQAATTVITKLQMCHCSYVGRNVTDCCPACWKMHWRCATVYVSIAHPSYLCPPHHLLMVVRYQ